MSNASALFLVFKLKDQRQKLNANRDVWQILTPEHPAAPASGNSHETKHCHTLENRDKDLLVLQDLEVMLGIVDRWVPECPEWKAAALMVGKRRYQRCLDDLESLIVSRMFELTKMNISQTGTSFISVYAHGLIHISRVQAP